MIFRAEQSIHSSSMRRSFLVLKMSPMIPLEIRVCIYRRRGIVLLCLEVISEAAIAEK
jgi:hypothetical protein